ncbi:peptidylprolyl isomerase [Dinghuibacter silviterrae]|uniref:Peptidyl-prolyl cis-trans isomerase n=1 Tax=Dinghuibacter silviterrae TaxID=1539049 RepID=A0A4R8DFR4_9BACT|nr:peptidylprolyl isomerase [Dinghuibacter silviterrae]TDW96315.1 peptidyl-prolyl cis-trans isomerase A (cyclophilin A) [Dinghuibacter silviterrae]
MRILLCGLFLCGLLSCRSSDPNKPHILIQTQAGDIEVELYPLQAPKTVKAFLSYVDSGLYKNGSFYRVLSEDNQPSGSGAVKMIQGGIWLTNHAKAVSLPGLPDEPTRQTHILHTDGVISLARTGPGTATTEFFICLGNQPGYDYGGENSPDSLGYTAFGKVVKGMDVVKAIYSDPENGQSLYPTVPIMSITRL